MLILRIHLKKLNQLGLVVFAKLKRIKIVFYKTGGLCKECSSEKVQCPMCNIFLNRSSLRKHMKRPHIKKKDNF